MKNKDFGDAFMEENELRRYYRTLVTCHSELCWLFEEKIDETAIRKLVKHFRDEMQRVEEELDRIEQADKKEGFDEIYEIR